MELHLFWVVFSASVILFRGGVHEPDERDECDESDERVERLEPYQRWSVHDSAGYSSKLCLGSGQ